MKNLYMLEEVDGPQKYYAPSTRKEVNDLIDRGEAEWLGTDVDEDGVVTHYAERIAP